MVGAAGSAIQFIVLLLVTGLLGLGLLLYAAHVFVTIAQQTAGGLDEITWPRDSWSDWIGQALHLALLVVFWAVPLGFVLRAVGPETPAASAALYVGVPAGFVWLIFPITLLSSFSAGSPLALVRPEVLGRMARGAGGTFGFFFLTAPVCVAGVAALYATLVHRLFYVLPALAAVLFVYARLVGRYSRLLSRVRLGGTKPKAEKEVRRAARGAQVEDPWGAAEEPRKKERPRKKKRKRAAPAHDPWAVPEDEGVEAEQGDKAETYGIAEEKLPPKRRAARPEPAVEGYDVNPEPPPPRPKEVPLDGSPPIEEKRTLSESETPLPDRPLVDGVFTFPWYRSNLGVWGLLTLLFLVWGWIYAALQAGADGLLRR